MLIGLWTAVAVSIYIIESLIPKPMPFLKLGLANIVVVLLMAEKQYSSAFTVALLKTLGGGLFTGTLFSPTTVMSLSGTVVAFGVMLICFQPFWRFSIIGISMAGAVAHNMAQLTVVRFLLIRENSIFYLTPFLILTGIGTGLLIGYIVVILRSKLNMKEMI